MRRVPLGPIVILIKRRVNNKVKMIALASGKKKVCYKPSLWHTKGIYLIQNLPRLRR